MRAIVTQPPGGWSATSLVETAAQPAGPDEVVVTMKAAGLNPADYFQIEGNYPGGPKPPFIAGRDGAGIVKADASGRWAPGTNVVAICSRKTNLARGTLCEEQVFSAATIAELPAGWTMIEGAAAPLAYQTAWEALVETGSLAPGQVVLVTGASGGVGVAAVQLASALGAQVIALSRSDAKRNQLLELGAGAAIDPASADLKNEVYKAAGKKGVDLVVENVGGPSLAHSVHLLGQRGRVAVVGLLAGVDGSFSIPSLLFKQARIEGVLVGSRAPEDAIRQWREIVALLEKSGKRPVIDRCYPFDDYPAAFERLRSGPMGKVVLAWEPDPARGL